VLSLFVIPKTGRKVRTIFRKSPFFHAISQSRPKGDGKPDKFRKFEIFMKMVTLKQLPHLPPNIP